MGQVYLDMGGSGVHEHGWVKCIWTQWVRVPGHGRSGVPGAQTGWVSKWPGGHGRGRGSKAETKVTSWGSQTLESSLSLVSLGLFHTMRRLGMGAFRPEQSKTLPTPAQHCPEPQVPGPGALL